MNEQRLYCCGLANIPNQLHEITAREGVAFSVLCVGRKNTGKKTTLKNIFGVELFQENGESVGDGVMQWKHEIIEGGFSYRLRVLMAEHTQKADELAELVKKQAATRDSSIQLCLFFVSANQRRLHKNTLALLKQLSAVTSCILVVAKADVLTENEKRRLRTTISEQMATASEALYPSAILQPFFIANGDRLAGRGRDADGICGRNYPWGRTNVLDQNLYNFDVLRNLLIRQEAYSLVKSALAGRCR